MNTPEPTNTPEPSQRRSHLALSPSRASDYKQCPLLFRLRAIDRLPEPKTVAQVKGTLVHAVLEDLHGLPRGERTYPAAVKMLKPKWQQMVADDPELLDLVPEEQTYDYLIDCRSLVKGYFHMENPEGFDAHQCEQYVNMTLPNGVPVRGFIDRVDVAPTGEVRVVDYKTGKKPLPRYSETAKFQMLFYALVWWRMTGDIPAQLRLMYLKVADDMVLSPSPAELQYFERDLNVLWQAITRDVETGEFQPRQTKLCGWCHFQDICPEFGGTPPEYPRQLALQLLIR
ncbi:RecB family exonuclease [Corynebacterium auriscanis]|uniref:RecB family exonuclease n=1 Tax=Corynebacterium auriscanis TaxID=99807 RepID=UPI003CF30687